MTSSIYLQARLLFCNLFNILAHNTFPYFFFIISLIHILLFFYALLLFYSILQPSAFSLGDICVPPMANVLKVFLENGQTKSFKYDSTTKVQVINLNLLLSNLFLLRYLSKNLLAFNIIIQYKIYFVCLVLYYFIFFTF